MDPHGHISAGRICRDLALDVIVPAIHNKINEVKQVSVMRIFILFFILVSAVIAVVKDAHPEITFIAQMMGVSWGALAGSFLAPFLYGLYWKGVTRASCYACFVWGCALMIIQMIVSLGGIDVSGWGPILGYLFASSVRSGVIAMVGSLIIVPVVSMFTRKQDVAQVDEMFECYDVRVSVRQTEALD